VVTPLNQGLPKTSRLLRPADFARVYGRRLSAASGPLVLYAAARVDGDSGVRVGLSVSRRIGNAVVRNRWKRRLREAVRMIRPQLPAAVDYVVVVRGGLPPRGADGARQIEATVRGLAERVTSRPGFAAERPAEKPRPRRRGTGR
jgi:ribonuclease P protein component